MSVMLEARSGLSTRIRRRFGPTEIARRPASSVPQVGADELRAPALERPHLGLGLAASRRADDQLELAARRSARRRARRRGRGLGAAPRRARSAERRRARSGAWPARGGSGGAAAGGDHLEDRGAAAADARGMDPADLLERLRGSTGGAWRARPARGRPAPTRPGGPRSTRSARARQRAPWPRPGLGDRAARPAAAAPRRCRDRAHRWPTSRRRHSSRAHSRRPVSVSRRSSSSASSSRWATSSAA